MQNKRLPRVLDYWETLRLNDNYMIYSTPPHPIKSSFTDKIIAENKVKFGYRQVALWDSNKKKR
jgi:hypothetical protein